MSEYEVKAGLAELDTFDVVGVSIVTDNSKATEEVNALWERFFKESVGQMIAHKRDDVIYAVYSNYEGDHEAPYRLTIGYRVEKLDVPEGMYSVRVEGGEYAVMSSAGEQPKALIETWEAIWSSDLPRKFNTDFEVYGPRFFEDGVHEVLVNIGIENEQN